MTSSSIRIAHFSDTHLGYRAFTRNDPLTGRNQRTVDIELAFERVITDIIARLPDVVIHSGDVFHHSRPSWHAMRHFVRQMRRIEQAGIPTVVIAGNHDTPRLRTDGSVYSVLELALPEIRFIAEYALANESAIFERLNLRVQGLPHGALTNEEPPFTGAMPGKRNVLVSHGVVPGGMPEHAHGEPGEQYLDANLLDPEFDYIALGHYHVHSTPKARAWYAGSTERMGFGDADATPGYAMVTLGTPGEMPEVEHIALPGRPMLRLQPVYADNHSAREVADRLLGEIQKLNSPEALVSVAIRNAERAVRREIEAIMRRESGEFCWLTSFIVERSLTLATPEGSEAIQTTDLRSLFAQFVQDKTGNPLGKEFATRFHARGDRALEQAYANLNADETTARGSAA